MITCSSQFLCHSTGNWRKENRVWKSVDSLLKPKAEKLEQVPPSTSSFDFSVNARVCCVHRWPLTLTNTLLSLVHLKWIHETVSTNLTKAYHKCNISNETCWTAQNWNELHLRYSIPVKVLFICLFESCCFCCCCEVRGLSLRRLESLYVSAKQRTGFIL